MRREDAIQAAIVAYLAAVAPDVLVYAVPNAARRTAGGRAGNAVAGLTAGIPDLALVLPGARATFIEVKTDAGRLSPAQQGVRLRMIRLGIPCVTARSIDDVRLALDLWGVRTREAVAA